MPTWNYEARDASGKVVRGAHEAADRPAALEFLRAQGLFLTRLEAGRRAAPSAPNRAAPLRPAAPQTTTSPTVAPRDATTSPADAPANIRVGETAPKTLFGVPTGPPVGVPTAAPGSNVSGAIPGLQNPRFATPPLVSQPLLRASSKDLSSYFRQLGAMINAGTTLGAALHSMREHAPNAALRNASQQIETRIMSGEQFSASMRAFPGLFTPLQIGMVSAGERGGFLVEMFARLARYSERDYDLQQTVKRETWYPKLLVFCSILIPSAIPLVVSLFTHKGNPFLLWLGQVWAPFLLLGGAFFGYRAINFVSPLAMHQSAPKLMLDRFKLLLPVGGKVARGFATAKFCRALGALYSAGVGPGESVRLSAAACGNAAIAEAAIRVIPRLEHGETLTECLKSTGYFQSNVMQVMAVGEQSGNLDEQLDKAADFLETDAEVAIKQSVQVFSILIFLCIAIYIGMTVAKLYLGTVNTVLDEGAKWAE